MEQRESLKGNFFFFKYIEQSENEVTIYQNMWDTFDTVLSGNFI